MRDPRTRTPTGAFTATLSSFFGAALVFVLSPVLLLLTGYSPEGEAYTNIELSFSLLAFAGASGCVAGLISNAYWLLEAPLPTNSPFVRLPAQPESVPGENYDEREQALPAVPPSLVLPTLISDLGGWVEPATHAPRAEARPSAA